MKWVTDGNQSSPGFAMYAANAVEAAWNLSIAYYTGFKVHFIHLRN